MLKNEVILAITLLHQILLFQLNVDKCWNIWKFINPITYRVLLLYKGLYADYVQYLGGGRVKDLFFFVWKNRTKVGLGSRITKKKRT